MRELKELALMIDPLELKMTTSNLLALEGDSKLAVLYKGLLDDGYTSDEEAFSNLYPEGSSTTSYRKLKSTLKKRLKDAVLLFDEKKHTQTYYQKAYYQCYKEWAVVKILLGRNAREAAVDVGQSLIKKARKFEFSDLVMDAAAVLRLHYGARLGDVEKFNQYNKLFKEYKEKYLLEEEAQEAYIDLIINYVNNRSPKSQQHERALQAVERLDQMSTGHVSRQFQLYRYLIKLMAATTIYDYKAALGVCESAVEYFLAKPYKTTLPLQIFFYQELVCYVQLGNFKMGQKLAKQCQDVIPEGSFNWFKFHELYFVLAMHTKNYNEAIEIFEHTTNHQRFQFLPENVSEIWKIYHSYLYYLNKVGKIDDMPKDLEGRSTFRLNRFLNEVPIFSKDKGGVNAAVLIIQTMIHIIEGNFDESINRLEATQQYCYRYLNTEHTQRTYLFLKVLLKVIQYGFSKEEVLPKVEKTLEKLRKIPLEVANQAIEVEIIPYEILWDYLLEFLD